MKKWALNQEPKERLDFLMEELSSAEPSRWLAASRHLKSLIPGLKEDKKKEVVRAVARLVAKGNFSAIKVLGVAGEDAVPFLPLLNGISDRHPVLKRTASFLEAVRNIVEASTVSSVVTLDANKNASLWKKSRHLMVPRTSVLVKSEDGTFAKGEIDRIGFRITRRGGKKIAVPTLHVVLDGGIFMLVEPLAPRVEMWALKKTLPVPTWAATSDPSITSRFGKGRFVKGVIVCGTKDKVLMKIKDGSKTWMAETSKETLVSCSPPEWGLGIASRLTPLTEGDVVEIDGGKGDLFVVDGFRNGDAVLSGIRRASGRTVIRPQALKYVGRHDVYRGVRSEPHWRLP